VPAGERRVFGEAPFALGALAALDADVGLRVGRLVLPGISQGGAKGLELEQVVLRLVLADRDLALRPFGFVLAGSHVAGDARVNARVAPPAMVLDVAAQQAEMGRLLALAGVAVPVVAKGDLVVALRGAGASPRALAGALEGNASLVVGQGVLKGDYVDALGLGALRQAVPQLQRLAESKLNCAIARFDVAKGVATARLIAADAGDLSLVGTGTVNLGTEAIALDLAPRLKLAVAGISGGVSVPVQVRGTLLEPVVSVTGGRPAGRGNPLAGLGRIVLDPGASAANPCGGLGEVRPAAPAPAPAPHVPGLPDVLRLLPR
jgi:AsmA protein